jgi:GDPmannose 4,6-dehydratase
MKRALICGVSGQDGTYLAQLLLDKGYEVFGTARDAQVSAFSNLQQFGIRERVQTLSMAVNDFRSVLHVLSKLKPDEVYNLSGQSSVGLSFEQPVEAIESIALGTLNLLEAIRFLSKNIRFYNAGSSECYGDSGSEPATEETPFRPRSPYAVAKASAHGLVANYREAYGLFACTGVLYNHESPLRPERFVTQKIVHGAARIAAGRQKELLLGNVEIQRDWGWAPEYVEAMWKMLQHDSPADFIIATGRTVSLEYFVTRAFKHFGLSWTEHVRHDPAMLRPTDIRIGKANPEKANHILGWRHSTDVDGVIRMMCESAEQLAGSGAG